MTTNQLLFGVLPYVVGVLAVVITIVRWRGRQFSVSSLSSQLLESRQLYWGSIPFHWGLVLILTGHFVALVVPSGIQLWNGDSMRLYLLEATGLGLAIWAAFGITVLIYRRLTSARIQVVTSPMDLVVLAIIATQIATGIWVAVGYRFGSFWGTSTVVPYVRSLFVFQPKPEYVEPLPFALQLHVLAFFTFVAVFPFTRLVHIITLPVQYLWRPWQRVVANREPPAVFHPTADRPLDRVE